MGNGKSDQYSDKNDDEVDYDRTEGGDDYVESFNYRPKGDRTGLSSNEGGFLGNGLTSPPTFSAPCRGLEFDEYRLMEQLGRGAYGEVWKASSLDLNTNVAIKFILRGIPDYEKEKIRVRGLSKKTELLNHPNICRVFSHHEHADLGYFVVMEYIDGIDLRKYRKNYCDEYGGFPDAKVVETLMPVASALDYAHKINLIHRDVKPTNIMIQTARKETSGAADYSKIIGVKLIDFGMARTMHDSSDEGFSRTVDTNSGTMLYMPPEQLLGEYQDGKTDLYALGIVAYELLAGHVPFESDRYDTMKDYVCNREPEAVENVSDEVNGILMKALAKKQKSRFETCVEFVEALKKCGTDSQKIIAQSSSQTAKFPPAYLSIDEIDFNKTDFETESEWQDRLVQSGKIMIGKAHFRDYRINDEEYGVLLQFSHLAMSYIDFQEREIVIKAPARQAQKLNEYQKEHGDDGNILSGNITFSGGKLRLKNICLETVVGIFDPYDELRRQKEAERKKRDYERDVQRKLDAKKLIEDALRLLKKGNLDNALAAAEKAIQLEPSEQCERIKNQILSVIEKRKTEEKANKLAVTASHLLSKNDYQGAMNAIRKAILLKNSPRFQEVKNLIYNRHYAKQKGADACRMYKAGNLPNALELIDKAIKLYDCPEFQKFRRTVLQKIRGREFADKAKLKLKQRNERSVCDAYDCIVQAVKLAPCAEYDELKAQIADLIREIETERSPGSQYVVTAGDLDMTFRWCPPGQFIMGSPADEQGRLNNEHLHSVNLTRGFFIQETPMTQAAYKKIIRHNPSVYVSDLNPVENVSYDDAVRLIQMLNEIPEETILPGLPDARFDLPTEAQWEYACRTGEPGIYASSKPLESMGWYIKNSNGKPHPVAAKNANAWGIYDMHGNVYEWCRDWYHKDYYRNSPPDDPNGAENGVHRVVRGGSWMHEADRCRLADRHRCRQADRLSCLGIRLIIVFM